LSPSLELPFSPPLVVYTKSIKRLIKKPKIKPQVAKDERQAINNRIRLQGLKPHASLSSLSTCNYIIKGYTNIGLP